MEGQAVIPGGVPQTGGEAGIQLAPRRPEGDLVARQAQRVFRDFEKGGWPDDSLPAKLRVRLPGKLIGLYTLDLLTLNL